MSCSLARPSDGSMGRRPHIQRISAMRKSWRHPAHDALSFHVYQKKRNDHSSREQEPEDKKGYASLDFDRIFDVSKGPSRPLRNLTKIPEDRIRCLTKQLPLQVVVRDIDMPLLNGTEVKFASNPQSDARMVCRGVQGKSRSPTAD
jgi:hypothetical protein